MSLKPRLPLAAIFFFPAMRGSSASDLSEIYQYNDFESSSMASDSPLRIATADFIFDSLQITGYLRHSYVHATACLTSHGQPSIVLERCPSNQVLRLLASREREFGLAGPEADLEAQTIADIVRHSTYRVDALYSSFVAEEDDEERDDNEPHEPQPLWLALAGVPVRGTTGQRATPTRVVGEVPSTIEILLEGYPVMLASTTRGMISMHALGLGTLQTWLTALDYSMVSVIASEMLRHSVLALVPSGSQILDDGSGRRADIGRTELRIVMPRVAVDQFVAALHAARLGSVFVSPLSAALQ